MNHSYMNEHKHYLICNSFLTTNVVFQTRLVMFMVDNEENQLRKSYENMADHGFEIWTCVGWPNEVARLLSSARNSQKSHFLRVLQFKLDWNNKTPCVGWPSGEKICAQIWSRSKWTQVVATTRKPWPSEVLAFPFGQGLTSSPKMDLDYWKQNYWIIVIIILFYFFQLTFVPRYLDPFWILRSSGCP